MVDLPEKVLKNLYCRILPQWKVCFLSAVIAGFAAHLYKLVNWTPNWDSIVFRYDSQNMLRLGRWFLAVACVPGSFYELPWLNGLLAVIYHALGAVCICKMFNIEKNITAALIGAVVITFPTVTSVMMYGYVADGYALSFFLACMAAAVLTGKRPKYAAAEVLITLSTAIYQAYVTVTVMLILLYLINELVFGKDSTLNLIKKTLKFLAAGAMGMALYYAVMMILLKITGETLLEYQGCNSAMSMMDIDLKWSLHVAANTFVGCFFGNLDKVSVFAVINAVILVLTAAMYAQSVAAKKIYKNPGRLALLAVYTVLLPLGATLPVVINPDIVYHNLMRMGYCVFYLFFIIMYEKNVYMKSRLHMSKAWAVLIIGTILIFNQTVTANVSYHKLQMAYEKSFGTLIRIADRIEQTENSESCSDILVIGALPGSEAYSVNLPPEMTGTTDSYILRADDETVGQSVLCSAINDYCGKEYRFVSGERKREMLNTEAVKEMDFWPGKNSVAVTDGIIVIKLGAESE